MQPFYEFGEFRLDLANKTLVRGGEPVRLTPKVFDTLVLLVERPGQLVEKEEFARRLWPETFVEDAALAENISRLRRALGDAHGQHFVETVPKRGYRFVADVTKGSVAEHAKSTAPGKWRTPATVAAITLLTLLVGATFFYARRLNRSISTVTLAPIRSLAVLPLENLSRDPDQEYFADGMTDELITQLAHIKTLRVISRTSVMRYKSTREPLAAIARALNVDAVVEGTVARSGERVRVTAQVLQVEPEKHLWAESYDRPLGDVLALQGELAHEIAQAISVKLTPQEERRFAVVRPVDRDAYEAFLKGRYYWSKRTERTTQRALEYYQQATQKDPHYAAAFAGLADSYLSLALAEALQETLPPKEAFPKARIAAEEALKIDDTLAEGHASLGHIKFQYDRDWVGAEGEFKRAIELNPNYANAHHWYALSLMWLRRDREALDEIRRARELDPLSLVINANLGFVLAGTGRLDEAVEQCRQAVDMDEGFAQAHFRLGQIYVLRGMNADAISELKKAIALSGSSPRAMSELGLAYARSGSRSEAVKLLRDLDEQSHRRYVSPFNRAVIYGGLGEKARTLEWLDKAYLERSQSLTILNLTPAFDDVRSDPRFAELVRQIGLPR